MENKQSHFWHRNNKLRKSKKKRQTDLPWQQHAWEQDHNSFNINCQNYNNFKTENHFTSNQRRKQLYNDPHNDYCISSNRYVHHHNEDHNKYDGEDNKIREYEYKLNNQRRLEKPIFIMNIDIEEDKPAKICIFKDTDPYSRALRFIEENDLSFDYIKTIEEEIRKTKNRTIKTLRKERNSGYKTRPNKIHRQYSGYEPNYNPPNTHRPRRLVRQNSMGVTDFNKIMDYRVTESTKFNDFHALARRNSFSSSNNNIHLAGNMLEMGDNPKLIDLWKQRYPVNHSNNLYYHNQPQKALTQRDMGFHKINPSYLSEVKQTTAKSKTLRKRFRPTHKRYNSAIDLRRKLPQKKNLDSFINHPIKERRDEVSQPKSPLTSEKEFQNPISTHQQPIETRKRQSTGSSKNVFSKGSNSECDFNKGFCNISDIKGTASSGRRSGMDDLGDIDSLFHATNNSKKPRLSNNCSGYKEESRKIFKENNVKDSRGKHSDIQIIDQNEFPTNENRLNMNDRIRNPGTQKLFPERKAAKKRSSLIAKTIHLKENTQNEDTKCDWMNSLSISNKGGTLNEPEVKRKMEEVFQSLDTRGSGQIKSYEAFLCTSLDNRQKCLLFNILSENDKEGKSTRYDLAKFMNSILQSKHFSEFLTLFN